MIYFDKCVRNSYKFARQSTNVRMCLPTMPRSLLRLMPMLLLLLMFLHFISCIRESNFHTVFTSGAKPPNNLACATKCGENDTCVGYDVTGVSCELLTLPSYSESVGHWVYLSRERVGTTEAPEMETTEPPLIETTEPPLIETTDSPLMKTTEPPIVQVRKNR